VVTKAYLLYSCYLNYYYSLRLRIDIALIPSLTNVFVKFYYKVWTEEEMAIYVRKEVELIKAGVRFINQALGQWFEKLPDNRDRTSIQNIRKTAKYAAILKTVTVECMPPEVAPTSANTSLISNSSNDVQEFLGKLLVHSPGKKFQD